MTAIPDETASANPKAIAERVTRKYTTSAGDVVALSDVSLTVREGEFVSIIGPSGCGKSTLLRLFAGLQKPTTGSVCIHRSTDGPANAMVFQDYALFPWRTVLDNVAFGLENRGVPKRERYEIARRFIDKVGLSNFLHAYPHQLSGGMKQRAGIARAFATNAEVLLMDEPLGALDAQTRLLLQELLLEVWEQDRKTVIYVTHSLEEAILLSDRVVVFTAHPGRIKTELPVELPRPRSLNLKTSVAFSKLEQELWDLLKDEVLAAAHGGGEVR